MLIDNVVEKNFFFLAFFFLLSFKFIWLRYENLDVVLLNVNI